MEDFMIFAWVASLIISLIFCIKWWRMTNDVEKIKEILQSKKNVYIQQAKEQYLLGNKEAAKELLDKSLSLAILNEIELRKEYEASNRDKAIVRVYDMYKKRYDKAGLEIKSVDHFLNKNSYL